MGKIISQFLLSLLLTSPLAVAQAPATVLMGSSFTVPMQKSAMIRDFALTREEVITLVSGSDGQGRHFDQLVFTSHLGTLRRRLDLPFFQHTYARLAVSRGGNIAVLRRVVGNIANLVTIDSVTGASRDVAVDTAGEQKPVEIVFLDENTLLAGAYDGIFSISLQSGQIKSLTGAQRVDLDPPFTMLPMTARLSNTIEFTPGRFRSLSHEEGFSLGKRVESPETSEIPQERIDAGAAIIYSAAVSPSGRIFCAISGTLHKEGARVIQLDSYGNLVRRFLLRLPVLPEIADLTNHKHGEMTPRLLRASETMIALSSMTGNQIVIYNLP